MQQNLKKNDQRRPGALLSKILMIMALFLLLPGAVQADMDLRQVYGLTDKKELEAIVAGLAKKIGRDPTEAQDLKAMGIAWHNLAVLKVGDAPEAAVTWLEKARLALSDDAEITAYLGSARTMIARDSWNVFTKTTQVNTGANLLDRAVSMAPDNIVVRMVRAKNSLRLPFFLNRKGMARQDFQSIEALMSLPKADVGNEFRAEVFHHLATLYLEDSNSVTARKYFQKSLTAAPNSPWGQASKERLNNTPDS